MRVTAYTIVYKRIRKPQVMKKELLSARVSADAIADARARASADGVSLTSLVEAALVEYLGLNVAGSKGPDLAARVADIEQRLSQIEVSGQGYRGRGKGRR
jgi:hypothetical protein